MLIDHLEWRAGSETGGLSLRQSSSGSAGIAIASGSCRRRFGRRAGQRGGSACAVRSACPSLVGCRGRGPLHDVRPGEAQTWVAAGIQGIARSWFDIDVFGYVGAFGHTQARVDAKYRVAHHESVGVAAARGDRYSQVTPTPNAVSAPGSRPRTPVLRVRYEFRREIAPYSGRELASRVRRHRDACRTGWRTDRDDRNRDAAFASGSERTLRTKCLPIRLNPLSGLPRCIDPVCGMTISPADAVGHVDYQGRTYLLLPFELPRAISCANPTRFSASAAAQGAGARHGRRPASASTPARWIRRCARAGPVRARSAGWRSSPVDVAPAHEVEWTCPMHPEIVRDAPGRLPDLRHGARAAHRHARGQQPRAGGHDAAVLVVAAALTLPMLAFMVSEMLPGHPLQRAAAARVA